MFRQFPMYIGAVCRCAPYGLMCEETREKSVYVHLLHLCTFTVIYCVCNTFNTAVKHIGLFIYLFIVKSCTQYSLTHSLLRLTSDGRSDLHNERSCAVDHSESIVHPWSSSTCCIQVFLGRPGGRFQSGAGQYARGWHSGPEIAMSSGRRSLGECDALSGVRLRLRGTRNSGL